MPDWVLLTLGFFGFWVAAALVAYVTVKVFDWFMGDT